LIIEGLAKVPMMTGGPFCVAALTSSAVFRIISRPIPCRPHPKGQRIRAELSRYSHRNVQVYIQEPWFRCP
jgi:hypothetical protein